MQDYVYKYRTEGMNRETQWQHGGGTDGGTELALSSRRAEFGVETRRVIHVPRGLQKGCQGARLG
jgi:hypothetical protein